MFKGFGPLNLNFHHIDDKKNETTAVFLELLEISKSDLLASELLYKHQMYKQAIFYCQQSIEKSFKALMLLSGLIKINELKKYSHKIIDFYITNVKNSIASLKIINRYFTQYPHLQKMEYFATLRKKDYIKQLQNLERLLQNDRSNTGKIIFLTHTEIEKFLQNIHSIKIYTKPTKRININEFWKYFNKFWQDILLIVGVKNNIHQIYFDNTDKKRLVAIISKILMPLQNIIIYLLNSYSYLSIMFLPHAASSRYPQDKLYPTKIYSKKLPIVNALPSIISIQKGNTAKIDKIIVYLKRMKKHSRQGDRA